MLIEKIKKDKFYGFQLQEPHFIGKDGLLLHNSGKTYGIAAFILECANRTTDKKRNICYISTSISKAHQTLYPALLEANKSVGLSIRNCGGDHYIIGGKCTVYLGGFGDKSILERARGYEFSILIIDEVQAAKGAILKPLIEQTLFLTMATYQGAYEFFDTCVILSGTPDYLSAGAYIREFYHDQHWKKYKGTPLDNPVIKDPVKFIEDYLIFNRMDYKRIDDPTKVIPFECNDPAYQREILGNIEFVDHSLSIFPHYYFESIPARWTPDVQFVMGIDVGWTDNSSIALLALDWDQNSLIETPNKKEYLYKKLWLIDIMTGSRWDADQLRKNIIDMGNLGQSFYRMSGIQEGLVVGYIDHNGQNVAATINKNSQSLPMDLNWLSRSDAKSGSYLIKPAIKQHKAQSLVNMSTYLKTKEFVISEKLKNSAIDKSLAVTKWAKDKDGNLEEEVDYGQYSNGHGDDLHAVLYGFVGLYGNLWGANKTVDAAIPMTPFDRFNINK
jgi:hypothetical protein